MSMCTRIVLSGLLCLLAACSTTPTAPRGDLSGPARAEALLAEAEIAAAPRRQALLLEAAALLRERGEATAATNVLRQVAEGGLEPALQAWRGELLAGLELERGEFTAALARLEALIDRPGHDRLPLERQLELGLLRAQALAEVGRHRDSAEQRADLDPMLPSARQQDNRAALWQSLMALPPTRLQELYRALDDPKGDLAGWLELALLARDSQLDLQGQWRQLEQWLARWPDHPAGHPLPDGLRLIHDLAERQPRDVALLLPTSGRLAAFGRAVRDGFMAAWYEQRDNRPTVRHYDAADADIVKLYERAVAEGAELVIGPLDKQQVATLQRRGEFTVPVLALNRSESGAPAPEGFYQFGLAPEDEAMLLAEAAARQRHQRALVLALPDDSSQRVVQVFGERWQALGGDLVGQLVLSGGDHSELITTALHLQRSQERARTLERTLGQPLLYTPRRRQDVDFILAVAQPRLMRSLKPLLAFHYAGNLPVFATSRIYEGHPQPMLDRDLNGIQFSDIPWLLTEEDPLREAILAAFPRQQSYLRLHALGVDSFRLYPRLEQLEQLPDSRFYGRTGNLSLNPRREVTRELGLARFVAGRPQRVTAGEEASPAPRTEFPAALSDELPAIIEPGTEAIDGHHPTRP